MRHNDPNGVEGTDLSDRDVSALTEYLTVLPVAPDVFEVVSQSGRAYRVDTREGGRGCTCKDFEYRAVECKHQLRVAYETGRRPIPEWIETDDLPSDFGRHVDVDVDVDPEPEPDGGEPLLADGGQDEDASIGPCPFEDPICGGVSGLFFGELSCFECYRIAPQNARDVAHCWFEMERSGRKHPALSGEVVA